MQQRQPRLGDILDDYCPRERRLTNHVVVAMVGDAVKQTRCTTCEAEHEYKHATVPRQRRKADSPAALYAQVLTGGPKRVVHDAEAEPEAESLDISSATSSSADDDAEAPGSHSSAEAADDFAASADAREDGDEDVEDEDDSRGNVEEGPVHRRLIRAALPKIEGAPPPTRPAPDFTIRQPAGRQNRFRPRPPRGAGSAGGFGQDRSFNGGDRSNGNVSGPPSRGGGGAHRTSGGRPPQGGAQPSRFGRRHGHKRSK